MILGAFQAQILIQLWYRQLWPGSAHFLCQDIKLQRPVSQGVGGRPDATMAPQICQMAPKEKKQLSGARTLWNFFDHDFSMQFGCPLAHFGRHFASNECRKATRNQHLGLKCEQQHKP